MNSYWLLLLVPIATLALLGALHRLGVLTVGLLTRDRGTTAGDVADDDLDRIDEDTRDRLDDAPDEPTDSYADRVDDRVRELEDKHDTDAGEGFDPEFVGRVDDGGEWESGDLLPVDPADDG